MAPKPPTAISIKERGNVAFKKGQLEEAVGLYRLAESKDANDRTYPSNLSAALYEIGDYHGSFKAICRAARLSSQDDIPFLLRLSMRLVKCLVQGTRSGTIPDEAIMNEFEAVETLKGLASTPDNTGATKELQSAWQEWDLVLGEAIEDRMEHKRSAQLNLARMDFKRRKLEHSMEYFHTCTEETMSMAHGWGNHENIPLDMSSYPDQQLSNVNFLIAGAGDGRHLLGTLIGLKNLPSLSKRQKALVRFHLTALDIHPASMARILVWLFLLNDLVDGQTIAPETKAEIIATYMYTFTGAFMPGYCHERLMATLDDLCNRLSEDPPRFPSWIFVPVTSIPPILDAIHYWMDTARTMKTDIALQLHTIPDLNAPTPVSMGMPGPMFPNPDNATTYSQKMLREVCTAGLESMTGQQLIGTGLVPDGSSPSEARQYYQRHKTLFVDVLVEKMKDTMPSPNNSVEVKWYMMTKTIPTPKVLEARHTALKQLANAVKKNGDVPRALITQAQREVETTWKPNITLCCKADHLLPGARKGYAVTTFSYPTAISQLREFNPSKCIRDRGAAASPDNLRVTYDWTSRMVDAAVNSLVALKDRVKVELICAEFYSEVQSMRSGDDHRPKEFPRSFLRIWMSDIPDCTHGVINVVTQALSILETDNEEAAIAFHCGFNSPAFESDEQFLYTYTFLQPKDVPRFLGCRIITGNPLFSILSLARLNTDYPLPLSTLATRNELTHWLSTHLIHILVPGMVHYPGPNRIRLTNNPVAFFRLLLHLHSIGYPSHWLSEFLQSVLRNDLKTEAVRATKVPIPVSHATATVSARKVDLAPWVPEFEMILAPTRAGLPFHVRLPEDFATTSEEIGTYEAYYRRTEASRPPMSPLVPFDHAAMLVFWRSNSIMYPEAVSQLIIGSISEKGRATPRSDLVVLNCLEGVENEKVRWKLAKKRVEKMKREGDWEMAMFRSDACAIVSYEVTSSQWREIST